MHKASKCDAVTFALWGANADIDVTKRYLEASDSLIGMCRLSRKLTCLNPLFHPISLSSFHSSLQCGLQGIKAFSGWEALFMFQHHSFRAKEFLRLRRGVFHSPRAVTNGEASADSQ